MASEAESHDRGGLQEPAPRWVEIIGGCVAVLLGLGLVVLGVLGIVVTALAENPELPGSILFLSAALMMGLGAIGASWGWRLVAGGTQLLSPFALRCGAVLFVLMAVLPFVLPELGQRFHLLHVPALLSMGLGAWQLSKRRGSDRKRGRDGE